MFFFSVVVHRSCGVDNQSAQKTYEESFFIVLSMKGVTMTIYNGKCVKKMREEYETNELINEILLRDITRDFGIGFLSIDVMAICWWALAQRKDSDLAANQLFVPIDEFLRSDGENSVCIVFDNAKRCETKVVSASRERNRLEKQGLSEEKIKEKLAEMNSRDVMSNRDRLQCDTVAKLRTKLGDLARRVTAVTAEVSDQAELFSFAIADRCSHLCLYR